MLIGMTGGMGSGKSSALKIFNELGCLTLDADAICHLLYSDGGSQLVIKIRNRWGDRVIEESNGGINRAELGKIVFENKEELQYLNRIVHPAVLEHVETASRNTGNTVTVFDVPLLYEAGWQEHFDKIITVWTSGDIRHQRLIARGMNEEEIKRRDKNQLSPDEKLERADYGLINNGGFEFLKLQCAALYKQWNK